MNRGISPLDPMSDVGRTRLNTGDTESVPFDPDEPGFGQYSYLSDEEIEEILELADGSIVRATGWAFRKIAAYFTLSAVSVTTDDLRLDSTARAKLFRELAQDWLNDADVMDAAAASDLFEVIPFGGYENQHAKTWPEATIPPYVL